MKAWIANAAGLALVAAAGNAGAQSIAVMTCTLPRYASSASPSGTATLIREDRVFRISRGSFQEWIPAERKFGPNLCVAFACVANGDRSEGTISSASVTYTVGINHDKGGGYWRAVGASGLAETEGACRRTADPSSPTPGP